MWRVSSHSLRWMERSRASSDCARVNAAGGVQGALGRAWVCSGKCEMEQVFQRRDSKRAGLITSSFLIAGQLRGEDAKKSRRREGQRPRRDREKRAGLPPSGERVRSAHGRNQSSETQTDAFSQTGAAIACRHSRSYVGGRRADHPKPASRRPQNPSAGRRGERASRSKRTSRPSNAAGRAMVPDRHRASDFDSRHR